ncbi:hypothetical protein F4U94_22775 [Sphingobium limneticum]|uniref:hypothetical protein n=1 Tax=Sphingobium limneticum TaxID=1007511 RepID=UPI00123D2806|nr:hypothetical protein [Sphingobium limneticum]KAA9009651.1 hypothetical protein F4U94_22775 [Sphingobium limneticum]
MDEKITETTKTVNPKRSRAMKAVAQELAAGAKETRALVETAVKGKVGKPTKFTEEKWERILACVASYGDLFEVCATDDMPSVYTVGDWIRKDERLMDDMRKAWQVFSMIGYSVNNNVLRGGVLSTGDKSRDFEIANNNRWHMSKTNRRDFGDRQQIEITTFEPVVLDGQIIQGPGGDGV